MAETGLTVRFVVDRTSDLTATQSAAKVGALQFIDEENAQWLPQSRN